MIKTYAIYQIWCQEVHVPSTNFYARSGESEIENLHVLKLETERDTLTEAEEYLVQSALENVQYVILPLYKKT